MKNTRLRHLLKRNNVKVKDLAAKIGISSSTLNRKIKGEVKFLERDIKVILHELNLSFESVFEDNTECVDVWLGDCLYAVPIDRIDDVRRYVESHSIEFVVNKNIRES